MSQSPGFICKGVFLILSDLETYYRLKYEVKKKGTTNLEPNTAAILEDTLSEMNIDPNEFNQLVTPSNLKRQVIHARQKYKNRYGK